MKRAVNEVGTMTGNLEASGFQRRQADAVIAAIANSIEKFAVTPEVLRGILKEALDEQYERIMAEVNGRFDQVDQRFEQVNQRFEQVNQRFEQVNQRFEQVDRRFDDQASTVNARFDDHRSEVNARFDDHRADTNARFNDLRSDMNKQFEAMRAEQRAEASRLFTLMLAIAMGMAGVVGSVIFGGLP